MIVLNEEKFIALIKSIVGGGINVELRNRPQAAAFADYRGARIELVMPQNLRELSNERREHVVVVDGVEQLNEEYVAMREGTIDVRVESDSGASQEHRAINIAESIRNALYRQGIRDRLRNDCGFAIAATDIVDLEYAWDDRLIDVAILTLEINVGYSKVSEGADYFNRVNNANEVPRDPNIPTIDQPDGDGGWHS